MKPILEVHNLGKQYVISHQSGGNLNLRERIFDVFRSKDSAKEDFWALRNISFQLAPGESIGVIGRNGAGKSTLLKILSKITPPTTGRIITRGRIASLLEVGTGFHPELTGRENVFFNGSLLGMKRREVESKFDEIVDFSGVEKFLDTPLKHYSSGMQLRLAFAVAAFLEPEILVIDEVLAVGDAEFQKKCLGKMEDVSRSGRTILFVSHNMAAVENLCSSGLVLDNGMLVKHGSIKEAIDAYQHSFESNFSNQWTATKIPASPAFLKRIGLSLKGSQPALSLECTMEIGTTDHHKDGFLAFDIANMRGTTVAQAIPALEPFIKHEFNGHLIKVMIDLPPLIPDRYMISVWMGSHNTETIFFEKDVVGFEIHDSPMKGRTFPHHANHGFVVPNSRVLENTLIMES